MSKISSPPLQMESLARCLGGCIFSSSRGGCMLLFEYTFWYILGQIQIWPMYQNLEKRVWLFTIISSPLKESLTLFQIGIFCYTVAYFVPFLIIKNRFTKINFKYFNGNCDYSSCLGWSILFSYAPAHKALAFWKNYHLS